MLPPFICVFIAIMTWGSGCSDGWDWGEVLGSVGITWVNYSIGQATCAVNIEAFLVLIF